MLKVAKSRLQTPTQAKGRLIKAPKVVKKRHFRPFLRYVSQMPLYVEDLPEVCEKVMKTAENRPQKVLKSGQNRSFLARPNSPCVFSSPDRV